MSPTMLTNQRHGMRGSPFLLGTCLWSFILANNQGYESLYLPRSLDGVLVASSPHEITSLHGFNCTFPSRLWGVEDIVSLTFMFSKSILCSVESTGSENLV
eukprot:jgi/Botrbrau1/17415/Bobra.0054s0011.1